jgi:hypothetical protein
MRKNTNQKPHPGVADTLAMPKSDRRAAPPGAVGAYVLSYLGLRTAVGTIGIALPFVLALGNMLLEGAGIESSISGYYYTGMRDVFVGSLCAIAVFMLSYHGPERADDIAGDLACIFALGLALVPAAPDGELTWRQELTGTLHFAFAVCFFVTLAYFSLVLFRKTDPGKKPTRRKRQRNRIYAACGITILVCIGLVVLVALLPPDSRVRDLRPVFWLESIAVVAFGVSWFTKGGAILRDEISIEAVARD